MVTAEVHWTPSHMGIWSTDQTGLFVIMLIVTLSVFPHFHLHPIFCLLPLSHDLCLIALNTLQTLQHKHIRYREKSTLLNSVLFMDVWTCSPIDNYLEIPYAIYMHFGRLSFNIKSFTKFKLPAIVTIQCFHLYFKV